MTLAVVSNNKNFERKVITVLGDAYSLKSLSLDCSLENVMRCNNIHCVVFQIEKRVQDFFNQLYLLKQKFPLVPHVCVTSADIDLDIIRYCGALGVDKVINLSRIVCLKVVVSDLIKQNNILVDRSEFGLEINYESEILNRTIDRIEKQYTTIVSTSELAQYVDVSDSTLSREFKKYNLVNPKRLLLYFKVSHALKLMRNRGLSMKEIIHLSGFTSEKRFYDLFSKLLPFSPRLCRKIIQVEGLDAFWSQVGETVLQFHN